MNPSRPDPPPVLNGAAPSSEAELAALVADSFGHARSLRIVGGRTRVETDADAAEPQLSVTGLGGIVDYQPGELTLIARAGTPVAEIETLLASQGQSLAFEPPESRGLLGSNGSPTVGGMVAVNASGPRRVLAGACRDHLLGVRFVDGRGRILKSGGRVMKNVTGLDLGKLLCGSFGTLGVLTEVALKTLPSAACQETLTFPGISPAQALDIFARALATPFEISGAAFHDGTAWLRLEGRERQLAYRRQRVSEMLRERQIVVVADSDSRALWKRLRDVHHFADSNVPLWRVVVKPSDAPAVVEALERLDGETSIDWGGGLVWYCGPAAGAAVRAVLLGGHATLVRRGARPVSEMFQPATPGVAALSASLRRTFDPASILNPGLVAG